MEFNIFGTERFFLTFFCWFLGPFEYYVGGGNDDIDSVRNHKFDVKENKKRKEHLGKVGVDVFLVDFGIMLFFF